MKLYCYRDVPAEDVEAGARGVKIRWLIKEQTGARNFFMRHFEIATGGFTPHHEHDWEHEVFILNGRGTVLCAAGEKQFGPGDVIFVPAGERHQFRNAGAEPVELLCLIPSRDKCNL